MALLAYLGILFLVPLLAAKEDEFAKYHAKQGLALFILMIVGLSITVVPVIGQLSSAVITLLWIILLVIGLGNVAQKKKSPLPFIGKYSGRVET